MKHGNNHLAQERNIKIGCLAYNCDNNVTSMLMKVIALLLIIINKYQY